ncbi:NgoFVII restriction endonuclease [Melghirimyces profundicolus]|uniref:NgoFVII restriction endonuclease n=1 Tax=Melghirimyces profundicolus TaxID=1242148 RepID=A0A2T6BZ19_9BACL|nr:phospholipase D family protein [Melghirimyces profundicolus]PTX61308.1 NgoFVII restriction endonuclease [Melghirimyces profundicolus]
MSFLQVVKDGQVVSMDKKALFDTERYDYLSAVTYVASPRYFFEATQGFSSVHLILGIEDRENHQSFTDGLYKLASQDERAKFWNSLDLPTKEKMRKGQYSVRFSSDKPIHSKIYLLSHSQTEETRLIMGSANFTPHGFGEGNQFEDVMVFDNDPLYAVYKKRFDKIQEETIDYIPDFIKKEKKPEEILLVDPDLKTNWTIQEMTELRDKKIAIPEETWEALQNRPQELDKEKKEAQDRIQLLKLVIQKDSKNKTIKPATVKMLQKRRNKITATVTTKYQDNEGLDNRQPVLFDPGTSQLYVKTEPEEGETEPRLIPYSKPATKEEIHHQLSLIHQFIDAYQRFTVEKEVENQKRIFEAILYGLTSPWMWKIRDHYATMEGSNSARSDFPAFLILAGMPRQGKTAVIEFLGMMMGCDPHYRWYTDFKSEVHLRSFFESEWIMPLLIDEIPDRFFTGKRGEELIKHVSNQMFNKHPCMIGTTNSTKFHSSPQNIRRIYYLQINNTFPEENLAESRRYLTRVQSELNASLFKDVTYRMGQKIKNDEPFYTLDDPLSATRQIFLDYYNKVGLEVPPYFPYHRFSDYKERQRNTWRNLYRQFSEHFQLIDGEEDKMVINIHDFPGTKTDLQQKVNLLPVECIADNQDLLIVWTDRFFNFIGMKKPKLSLLRRITLGIKGSLIKQ